MRKEKDLHHVSDLRLQQRSLAITPKSGPAQTIDWKALFLPKRETRLMADEAGRTGGVFIPYPVLGLLLALTLALGGGIIGLYASVQTMNTTMFMRDTDYRDRLKEQKDKLDQIEIYLHNDRERLAVVERERESQQRKKN